MIAIGLDVHTKNSTIAYLDTQTGETRRRNVRTDRLPSELDAMDREQCRIGIEVSSVGVFVARQLFSCGFDVVVVDAFKAHRIIESQNTAKTDRRDATALAKLLANGQADELAVWVPDEQTLQLRMLTRSREALVRVGTQLRNQLRALVRAEGSECSCDDLTGRRGREWMEQFIAGLPELAGLACRHLFAALLDVKARVDELEQEIVRVAKDCEQAQQLMTINGCGAVLALSIVAEIGDVSRFKSGGRLRSYSGLTPRLQQSGGRSYTGPITKRGNPHLRRAVVLLAHHFARTQALTGTRLKRKHWQVLMKHGPKPARVDLARRLLSVIHAMLRDGTDFDAEKVA